MNAYKVPITVVQIHPREELVATGDEMGRIFLWRNFYDNKTVCTVKIFKIFSFLCNINFYMLFIY